jgi:hypothetical protein
VEEQQNEKLAAEAERKRLSAANFANYTEYNKTLRTWFVTFGLGAPSLFLINNQLGTKLASDENHKWIVAAYLIGCGAQVVIALINKFTAWHGYHDQQFIEVKHTLCHRLFRKLDDAFWIDMLADVATSVLFAYATWKVFDIFS